MVMPQPDAVIAEEKPRNLRQALPLKKFVKVLETLLEEFRNKFTPFDETFSSLSEDEKKKPAWEGAVSWVEIRARLTRNENSEDPLDEDVCMEKLREVANKPIKDVTSHDLRKVLLVSSTTNVAADTQSVSSHFSTEEPCAALSYRWAVKLEEINEGLKEACDGDKLVWVDIFFNPQNFEELTASKVVDITISQYTSENRKDHFLLIPQDEPADGSAIDVLMGRGWIALEMAARMASKLPLVQVLDKKKQAAKWYLTHRHLTADTAPDFFDEMTTWNESDKAVIQAAIIKEFKSKEAFNRTVLDAFLAIGGKQLITEAEMSEEDEGFLSDCKEVCAMLYKQGKFQDCAVVAQRQLKATIKVYGEEHLDVARCQSELAEALTGLSRYDEAIAMVKASLHMRQRLLGEGDHEEVARCLQILGTLLLESKDFAAAKEKMSAALEMRQKVLGPNDLLVAKSLQNLGMVHRQCGALAEAMRFSELSKEIKVMHYGADNIEVAEIEQNIASILVDMGEPENAVPRLETAFAIKERVLGIDNPRVADSLNNLGVILWELGNKPEACEHLKRALAIYVKAGNDDLHTAYTYKNLCGLHLDLGDEGKAFEYAEEEYRIKLKVFGAKHPETIKVWEWLKNGEKKAPTETKPTMIEKLGSYFFGMM